MTVTIYHNPKCGTSRNVLAMLREAGEEPEVIEYLKTPPGREKLVSLIAAMGVSPRAILRQKGTPYDELGLGEDKWSDDELIDFRVEPGPDEPPHRGDAARHETLPPVRDRAGAPAGGHGC